jgi:superfamily II DNA or RNA helicase
VTEPATDPLDRLRKAFGDLLYYEAERLVEHDCVSEVRVLQSGEVTVGVARSDAEHGKSWRVYVRNRIGDGARHAEGLGIAGHVIDGECNCGQRAPCAHIAAVLIAAASRSQSVATQMHQTRQRQPPPFVAERLTGSPISRQRILYLLEPVAPRTPGVTRSYGIQLTPWIVSPGIDGNRVWRERPQPFALRAVMGGERAAGDWSRLLPRYVDAQDTQILKTLAEERIDGPWELLGATGANLLRQAVATGRVSWQSLLEKPLRYGATRQVSFMWETLPNADQRLRCSEGEQFSLVLSVEPAIYVDGARAECGPVDLPCSQALLLQHWTQTPISPERAQSVNDDLAHDAGAAEFPRPRLLTARREPLESLKGRLVLAAGTTAQRPAPHAAERETAIPKSVLYFVYNNLPIDSRALRVDQTHVRQMDGGVLREIPRDPDTESRLRARLQEAFAQTMPEGQSSDCPDRGPWLAFMMTAVPALQADGWEVVEDSGFPWRLASPGNWYGDLARQPATERELPAKTQTEREWFDLRLGLVVDGHAVNLLPALAHFLQAPPATGNADSPAEESSYCLAGEHLFVRIDDGRYVPLAIERVRRIADTLVELFDENSLTARQTLPISASQTSRLAQLAGDLGSPALRSDDESLSGLIADLADEARLAPLPAPDGFRATLREYQQEGLGWLQFLRRHRLGGILADDMGLGKTVQTLAHLSLEKEQGRLRKPTLIVAPVSVIGNWSQEIRRFAPDLRVLILHGARRKESFCAIGQSDIVITSYALMQLDSETLLAREFYYAILDEAQTIKNPRANVSRCARLLRAEHRLCLTGTPMENHLGELWSLFEFLQPGALGEEKLFQRHYRAPIEKHGDKHRLQALTRRIAPLILRRAKDTVARELPAKTQIVETLLMDERQRDLYDGIRLTMHRRVREIIERQGLARSRIMVLDALLKLRQACCDPRLVHNDAQTMTIPSAKMDWLRTVLPELVAEGRRVLLFSQFTSMLALIEEAVDELGIPCCVLTGETRNRSAEIARFQAGETPLFLLSLKAGGTGLNLTAADTVIHYDPWWNPAAEAQATDRAHRIGQDKPVFVHKVIIQGTVEEKILRLQEEKHELAKQLYEEQRTLSSETDSISPERNAGDAHPESAALPSQLSAADVEALFE